MISDAEFDNFLDAGRKAICRYSQEEFERLARKIENQMRRMPGGEHRNFWSAFCEEMQRGPSPLREAFEFDIEKMIDFTVSQVRHRKAVLLTIAAMWEADDFERQDGELVAPDLLKDQVFGALRQLALDDEGDQFSG